MPPAAAVVKTPVAGEKEGEARSMLGKPTAQQERSLILFGK